MKLRIIAVWPGCGVSICPFTHPPYVAAWAREFRLTGATIWEEWS